MMYMLAAVRFLLGKIKSDDDLLVSLHSVLYKRAGKVTGAMSKRSIYMLATFGKTYMVSLFACVPAGERAGQGLPFKFSSACWRVRHLCRQRRASGIFTSSQALCTTQQRRYACKAPCTLTMQSANLGQQELSYAMRCSWP